MDDEAVGFFLTSPNTFINQRLTINFTMTNRRLKVDGEGVWRCGREEPRYEGFVRPFQPTFIRLTKSFPTEGWISCFLLPHGSIAFFLVYHSFHSWWANFFQTLLPNQRLVLILEEVPNQRLDWKKCCSWVKRMWNEGVKGYQLPTFEHRFLKVAWILLTVGRRDVSMIKVTNRQHDSWKLEAFDIFS